MSSLGSFLAFLHFYRNVVLNCNFQARCLPALSSSTVSASSSPIWCGNLGLLLHNVSHRGQDACGIVISGSKGRFFQCKANGTVRDVLDEKAIARLIGGMGIGHVRYPTAGSSDHAEAQPFYVNSLYTGKFRINEDDIFTAMRGLMGQCTGAYACVAMLAGFGIIALRDSNVIRPSIVADALGFSEWEDVELGEAVIITRSGVSKKRVAAHATLAPDNFEFVYFVRPVERALKERGITMDVVIPVPDMSRVVALNLAQKLNLPYVYERPTFIMPGFSQTEECQGKSNAMALEFSGKNVLLVQDSIVRGTTSEEIIDICAPPIHGRRNFRHSNVYGIDKPSRTELVAYGRNTEEIAEAIGVDLVVFQTLPDLIASEYVTGGVNEESLRADNVKNKVAVNSREGQSEGNRVNGFHTRVNLMASGGPVNSTDDTVGLHNTWNIS
ncbi:nucleophile aminohydrolase [Suillus subaureus]|uniref:Nucleophile aminohydrolase n=1 Tax=Suillus subaureus TaxID=48587 RepID=A0A9P7JGU8_9AGAM|nr:nucleophile aminohydrolase [Suillus subaureus]KAG1822490.1 nucleophile aminohydrolase [Suillus subaureus]